MPTLETPDGKPVDVTPVDPDEVNRRFEAAMNDDGPDAQAPPKRQLRIVPDGDAPKPRRGRQPRAEKSRTADQPAKAAADVKDDYTADAQQFVGGVWTVMASISLTQPYALVVENSSDALVSSLAEGAKRNATVRAFVSSGESSWMLGLGSTVIGMGMQAYQLMKDPALRKEAAEVTRQHLREAMDAKGITTEAEHVSDVPAGA
jgi:hypothetical protein